MKWDLSKFNLSNVLLPMEQGVHSIADLKPLELQAASTGRDGGYALIKGQSLNSIQRRGPKKLQFHSLYMHVRAETCTMIVHCWSGSAGAGPKLLSPCFRGNARHLANFLGEFNTGIIRLISLLQLDQYSVINK
jgi:hypothetical protein